MTGKQKELNGPRIWQLLEKVDSNLRGNFTELLIVGGAALSIHWMIQRTHDRGTFDVDVGASPTSTETRRQMAAFLHRAVSQRWEIETPKT